MQQYGDITKLNGEELEPVDLIVGGSPCQDLSVAGKRAGLEGERSGLFMEMIRIIKEMKRKTNGLYPRFALWENVPGAFSSNNGRDFSAVLGEFSRIIDPNAPDVPCPEEGWSKAGVLLVSNGSIAWRTHDAQFWGVPQRRRRISLVADFRGQSAWEILFERKGVSGNPEPGEAQREDPAGTSADSTGSTSAMIYDPSVHHGYCELGGVSETVRSRYGTGGNNVPMVVKAYALSSFNSNAMMSDNPESGCYETEIAKTIDNKGGNAACHPGGTLITSERNDSAKLSVADCNGQLNQISMSETANALDTMHDQQMVLSFEAFGVDSERQTGSALKARNDGMSNCDLVIGAKCSDDYKGVNNQIAETGKLIPNEATVRRLTPLECERLQGYPDGWTDISGATDSKRYKALGNSIALPFWEHLAKRFVEIGKVKSIGSLFDGIGGFPLVFQRAGAKTLWNSEIEPFCQKVVEYHLKRGEL